MATNWAVDDAKCIPNEKFLKKAQELIPQLIRQDDYPVRYYMIDSEEKRKQIVTDITEKSFGKGDTVIVEFMHNHPAYLEFQCEATGSPQDAPALLRLRFCETEKELYEDWGLYNGWISKGWLQQEVVHIDEMPHKQRTGRRYSFRYVRIDILDTSQKFKICFSSIERQTVSSAKGSNIEHTRTVDPEILKIDEIALRTQVNCMQTVFEDGPKRDRRLWLGDLRIQALVNYKTYKNNELVKRCLYLFAGLPREDGMVPACLFEKPEPLMDDTFLLDYSLFFVTVLLEYYEYTNDRETLEELAETALRQIRLAQEYVDANGLVEPEGRYHCFVDWNELLDKQCAMQGILIYTMQHGKKICEILGKEEEKEEFEKICEKLIWAAKTFLWNDSEKVFVSGRDQQISLASQVWMVISGAVKEKEAENALMSVTARDIKMITPYMHHFYVTALFVAGQKEKAMEHLKEYWGGMVQKGADTFWELYNPENPEESPYGAASINSYCHAWSCSPAYILRNID